MLQAFVSLKQNQPPKTDLSLKAFFNAIAGAMYTKPTHYCTNYNAYPKAYDVDEVTQAVLDPKCKFVVIRAHQEKFWQLTCLIPDANSNGALFIDFEHENTSYFPDPDFLLHTTSKLYKALNPNMIKVGDSEAREKLKSKHGLVLMPGLGRIDWLQLVSPDVYASRYNPSELVAAPAYSSEIWPDGTLALRVYGDPKDWENEDNISLANFIPGFLAGTANFTDGELEKKQISELEKLRSRAENTAKKAYEVFAELDQSSPQSIPAPSIDQETINEEKLKSTEMAKKVHQSITQDDIPNATTRKIEITDIDDLLHEKASKEVSIEYDDAKIKEVLINRLKTDYTFNESSLKKVASESICEVYEFTTNDNRKIFASHQDLERKVYVLEDINDFAKFLFANQCNVAPELIKKCAQLTQKYHKPNYKYIASQSDLPADIQNDKLFEVLSDNFNPEVITSIDGTKVLHLWFLNQQSTFLEELKICQFEDWLVTIELEKHYLEGKPAEHLPFPKVISENSLTPQLKELPESNTTTKILVAIIVLLLIALLIFILKFDADFSQLF